MNSITIDERGQVRCSTAPDTVLYCDPIAMFDQGAACGNCPILLMCESYERTKFGIGYDEMHPIESCNIAL